MSLRSGELLSPCLTAVITPKHELLPAPTSHVERTILAGRAAHALAFACHMQSSCLDYVQAAL